MAFHLNRDVGPRTTNLRGSITRPAQSLYTLRSRDHPGPRNTRFHYLPAQGRSLPILPPPPPIDWVDPARGVTIATPYVTLPDFLEARCAERDGFSYLEITVNGDPADPRIDDIGSDLTPDWGLHLVDVNVAMSDLVTIARKQSRAWCSRRPCRTAR